MILAGKLGVLNGHSRIAAVVINYYSCQRKNEQLFYFKQSSTNERIS